MQANASSALLSMERLVETIQQLSLAPNLESVMRIVRSTARSLTGADGATFVLREGDKCYYADEDAISPLWKGNRFPMETCISGWVMLHKKNTVIENIYADDRIPAAAYRPTFVKSLIMVPIRTMDPIGAIGTYWAVHHKPSVEEVAVLQALADVTAVSMENISVRNSLEQQVLARTKELADSLEREKMLSDMKSTFVSMAAHEFRTPLSTIMSSISLTQNYVQTGHISKCIKHFDRIKSSVHNLTDIMNDFLSLEKLEQGKVIAERERLDLRTFLRSIVDELDSMLKEKQAIHFSYAGCADVYMDKKIIRNILLNLLSNAIKYSDQDIDLRVLIMDDQAVIVVKDRGIGIPEEQQQYVFGKFFRASNVDNRLGTGLGLNIVKHYVELLDGTIHFSSKKGEGTSFSVSVPIKTHYAADVDSRAKPHGVNIPEISTVG